MNDDFFPHCAAEAVGQVVDLVHDHIAEVLQQSTSGIEHVAEHLGRHDDHPGAGVNTRIAGEQSNF